MALGTLWTTGSGNLEKIRTRNHHLKNPIFCSCFAHSCSSLHNCTVNRHCLRHLHHLHSYIAMSINFLSLFHVLVHTYLFLFQYLLVFRSFLCFQFIVRCFCSLLSSLALSTSEISSTSCSRRDMPCFSSTATWQSQNGTRVKNTLTPSRWTENKMV